MRVAFHRALSLVLAGAALVACAPRALASPGAAALACTACHLEPTRLDARGLRALDAGGRELRAAHGRALQAVVSLDAALVRLHPAAPGPDDEELPGVELRAALPLAGALGWRAAASLDSTRHRVRLPVAMLQWGDAARADGAALRAGRFEAGLPFLVAGRPGWDDASLAPASVDAHGVEVDLARAGWTAATGVLESRRTRASGASGLRPLEDTEFRLEHSSGRDVVGARVLFDRQDSNVSWHAWLQRLQVQAGGLVGAGRFWCVPAWTLDRFDDRPAPGVHQRNEYVSLETIALLGARRDWSLSARAERERTPPTRWTPGSAAGDESLALSREFAGRSSALVVVTRDDEPDPRARALHVDASLRVAY
jgi:hypothetical protein